jgi:hypothetical protein
MSVAVGNCGRGNAAARNSAKSRANQTTLCTRCASGGKSGDRHAEQVGSEFF